MKKLFFIALFFLPLITKAQIDSGQTQIQYNYTADLAYTEDFSGAIRMYKQMIAFDPKNPVFHYKLGFAYLNTFGKQDSAIIFLRKAEKYYKPEYRANVSPFDIKFYLARAYRLNKQPDSSIIILEKLRQETMNDAFVDAVNKELDEVKASINNLFTVTDLDSVINSSFSEHSPVYSPTENILIFTSRRYNDNSIKYDDGQYDEDIYFSKRVNGQWSSPQIMEKFSTQNNDASASITTDGQELLIYKDDDNGSIYISKYVNGQWTTPEKLPKPINTRHRETHASLSPDGKIIYFTSDRPGGMGGLDIWYSVRQPDGSWSKPVNLGDAVNSKGDEESPNLSNDGKTLYFSSNGRGGFGGFDIFKSEKTEFNTWTVAENLGYPINSIGDDIFFTPITKTDKAFYTSYRYGSKGNADIFVVYLDSSSVNTKTINIGYVLDSNDLPVDSAEIVIVNKKTNQKAFAKPSPSGKFIFITEPNNDYTLYVTLNNKTVYTDNFQMPDSVPLKNFYKKIRIPATYNK